MTLLLEHGWLSVDSVGLEDHQDITSWNAFVSILKSSHVRLSNDDDMLIWNQAKSGKYTPKTGYLQLFLDRHVEEVSWWWKVL